MIQTNLLPDVKLEYIKAQRTKHLVISVSLLAGVATLVIFVILMLTVNVWQKKTINDLSGDIEITSSQLKQTPDLDKILTIQNQLNSLSDLHDKKPVVTRFTSFMEQVTPTEATISDVKVDYAASTMTLTGGANSLDIVNTFVDGLKFTKYTTADNSTETQAFSNVVLTTFSRTTEGATYTIDLVFDPIIFSNASDVTLVVPNIITTRSITEQPSALFEEN